MEYSYTAGKAARYLSSAVLNFSRFICIMVLSTTVAFCIIQISLTDRPISVAAISISRPVSILQKRGISMAARYNEYGMSY